MVFVADARRIAPGQRLPGHAGGHRLPHDDGQRARRARLGRRRDRGRGGDAGPADVDADPAGGRLPAARRAARGGDRDRPRADRHRDAARARAWWASSWSSTAPVSPACRWPTARRSATCRRSSAPPARSSRSTRRRCATCGSPAGPLSRSSWSRPTRASRGCGTTRARPSPPSRDQVELDLGAVVPSIAGPKRPQDRVSLTDAQRRSEALAATPARRATRAGLTCPRSAPSSDPASSYAPRRVARAVRSRRRPAAERARRRAAGDARRRHFASSPRPRGDRGDHQLHQHLQPLGDDRGRAPRAQRARHAACSASRGSRPRWRPGPRWSPNTSTARGSPSPSSSSGSTSSATAAPPASATPGRCRRRSPRSVGEEDLAVVSVLSGNRNFEGRINPDVKMNYLASPPLCVAYALAGTMDIDIVGEPLGQRRRRRGGLPARHLAQRAARSRRRSSGRCSRTCSARATARCSPATSAGTGWRSPPATASPGMSARPTCACRPTSRACPPSPSRSRTSTARACWRCSATASPPTTSHPRARSSATGPPGSTCRSTAWRRATSTPTARAAATTR